MKKAAPAKRQSTAASAAKRPVASATGKRQPATAQQVSLDERFMNQEVFDGAFFDAVFGNIKQKTSIDFMNMFHQAVKQRNLALIAKIK